VWQSVRSLPPWLRGLLIGQFVNAAGALAWVYLTLYLEQTRQLSAAHAVLLTGVAVDTSYRQLYVGLALELHRLHPPTVVYGLTVTANCVIIVAAEVWVGLRMAKHPPGRVIAFVCVSWLILAGHPAVAPAFVLVAVISVAEMLYKPTAAVVYAAPAGYEARYRLYAGGSISGSISGSVIAPPIGRSPPPRTCFS
jgi:hypothetical protein